MHSVNTFILFLKIAVIFTAIFLFFTKIFLFYAINGQIRAEENQDEKKTQNKFCNLKINSYICIRNTNVMEDKYTKKFFNWLLKETPEEGGCMLCRATYKFRMYSIIEKKDVFSDRSGYFLIEKHKLSNGYMFNLNGRFFYDYDFIWKDGNENHWEILYKKEI